MEPVDITVFYLEMHSPLRRIVPPPRDGLAVTLVPSPSVAYYRSLYNAVGEDYRWLSRRKMSDETLAGIIGDPQIEMHVLSVDGAPAGFVDLDRRQPGEIEIVQFGLMPGYLGQGLGRWFLQWTIDQAWSYAPKRLWLHTCTLDHPGALPNYLKSGFVEYKQEVVRREY